MNDMNTKIKHRLNRENNMNLRLVWINKKKTKQGDANNQIIDKLIQSAQYPKYFTGFAY